MTVFSAAHWGVHYGVQTGWTEREAAQIVAFGRLACFFNQDWHFIGVACRLDGPALATGIGIGIGVGFMKLIAHDL